MLLDKYKRPLGTVRLSVTDRCNLRCAYCMPEDDYVWLPGESILSAAELERVARVLVGVGAKELRITGGEPLMRADLVDIVARLRPLGAELALTTNGVTFAKSAKDLARAGLTRVTISLDTLRDDRAKKLSRTTRLADVKAAFPAAREAGLARTKLNTVVMRGENDDELAEIIAFAREHGVEARFIEYMDVGGATRWSMDQVVPLTEIVARVSAELGPVTPLVTTGDPSPATRFRLDDGTVFGVIASMTAPFCGLCDRARLTADGVFFTCLYAETGVDLRTPMREDATDEALRATLERTWTARADRGAEERAHQPAREVLIPVARLRADPHREMHTRGG